MGCLFACALHKAGLGATLIVKDSGGLNTLPVILERDDDSSQRQLPVSEARDPGGIHHLLVTTKAYDIHSAVLSLAHRLDENSQVLLLANGMGFSEPLRRDLPGPNYYFGTTTAGAYRLAPRHIRQAGEGLTRIGHATVNHAPSAAAPGAGRQAPAVEPPAWFDALSAAVSPCQWDGDISQALWLKLAINCAINPLTALHRCVNGELARQAQLVGTVARLCDEIMAVSVAAGYGETTANLHWEVAQVIAATADNRSSMLQDVLAGRVTEIDFITGHLLRVAASHGVATPENENLLARILNHAD